MLGVLAFVLPGGDGGCGGVGGPEAVVIGAGGVFGVLVVAVFVVGEGVAPGAAVGDEGVVDVEFATGDGAEEAVVLVGFVVL